MVEHLLCQHVAQERTHYDIVGGVMNHFGLVICHLIRIGLIKGNSGDYPCGFRGRLMTAVQYRLSFRRQPEGSFA